jgi:ribosome biogenesis GTPase A
MQFQWYPGHMTKAKRQMQEDIKLIDLVIELVDARIPLSSRNPDIDELGKNKARLIIMNKSDLSDENQNKEWAAYFKKMGYYVVGLDARTKTGMKTVTNVVMEACKEKIERDRRRGILNRPVRAMVVGNECCALGIPECDGSRNSKCWKIDVYQFLCGKGMCQNWK